MKVFFDTEFTGLYKDTTLISIGMVDEDGREFYAEFLDYDSNQVDKWIKDNVIKNLNFNTAISNWNNENLDRFECVGYTYYIRQMLHKWLSQYNEVQLVSDVCHYDMVLFISIFGGAFDIPNNVNASCHDINQDIANYYKITEQEAFNKSRESILTEHNFIPKGNKHDALYDAQVIKVIYNITNKIKGI